ncbi:DNA ligase D [uncultured Alsobacter sp.]|uniref:DNA ligase D n=1 Tax=uncultured Alsobacter sp. TaxID=1748258 RepID=UPI0025F6DD35|nr:DNA ligase D [uncultured Alsobacter sp.]
MARKTTTPETAATTPRGTKPSAAAALQPYEAKRSFDRTPEPRPDAPPRGKPQRSGGSFVVQKHDATRLHYDLRLELDGVLKSWAVTRGPSLVPGDKRLAVRTEDHPMKYLDFEGVIPAGEYGGGTMIVWDRGQWTPDADPQRGFAKGHIDFTLAGERLKGRWHLVRMRPRARETTEQWLLIKGDDEHARAEGDPDLLVEEQTSLKSGKTNDELAAGGVVRSDHAERQARKAATRRAAPAKDARTDAAKTNAAKTKDAKRPGPAPAPAPAPAKKAKPGLLPVFVDPMLATLTATPPTGGEWIHEIKFDGYRIQARVDGSQCMLLTRKGLDWTQRFAAIATALKDVPAGSALIDGEVIVEASTGVSDFSALQADLSDGRQDRMIYAAFDLLYLEGKDLRRSPLGERRRLLEDLFSALPAGTPLRFSEHVENDGATMLRHACRLGLEGIVSKRRDAPYASGRGGGWLKAKCTQRQEFVVVGFTRSTAASGSIGALVLAVNGPEGLVLAGRVGTGFSTKEAQHLARGLGATATKAAPLGVKPPAAATRGVTWVEPRLVAEVEFRGWTADGLLRQASFKGLRDDKPVTEVVREETEGAVEDDHTPELDLSGIRLTHPERVLWEEQGITKLGLAEFYAGIADWVLPHVTGRPLSLVRCPSGAAKQCFFQKHRWEGLSPDIQPVDVGDEEPMTFIADLRGLIGLVQAGVLEIHPWGSRVEDLDHPDRLIFDLDPGEGVTWQAVVDGAVALRDRLSAMGLESFVKTSGGKGLHVVVPLVPSADWDTAKAFTKEVVDTLAADEPARYLATMSKAKRKGRIFLDYLRNGRGATAVAAFSTRARAGAPVSTPLAWSELGDSIRADHFTVANLRQRLDYLKEDPWKGFFETDQVLPGSKAVKPRKTRKR